MSRFPPPNWRLGLERAKDAPLCDAWARSAGRWCRQKAMPNGKCYIHGGKNPGAPRGNVNALKHGGRSPEAAVERAMRKASRIAAKAAIKLARKTIKGKLPQKIGGALLGEVGEVSRFARSAGLAAALNRNEKLGKLARKRRQREGAD